MEAVGYLEHKNDVSVGLRVDCLHEDGDWHRATVIAVSGGQTRPAVRVHYNGYSNAWDETVRLRTRRVRRRVSDAALAYVSSG